MAKKWTNEDDFKLFGWVGIYPYKILATRLNRTIAAIKQRVYKSNKEINALLKKHAEIDYGDNIDNF